MELVHSLSQVTPHKNQIVDRSVPLVQSLLKLLQLKDSGTHAHVNRVYGLAEAWVEDLQRRQVEFASELNLVPVAALLHDIGKLGVLDEVLLKNSFLSEQEREHLERHAELGYQMIRDEPGMSEVALFMRHHHERFDGKGYPLGLKAKKIPLGARMIAIIDAYDAITSERPYREARSHSDAMKEIEKNAGQQFCPEMVSWFMQFMHARNT